MNLFPTSTFTKRSKVHRIITYTSANWCSSKSCLVQKHLPGILHNGTYTTSTSVDQLLLLAHFGLLFIKPPQLKIFLWKHLTPHSWKLMSNKCWWLMSLARMLDLFTIWKILQLKQLYLKAQFSPSSRFYVCKDGWLLFRWKYKWREGKLLLPRIGIWEQQ